GHGAIAHGAEIAAEPIGIARQNLGQHQVHDTMAADLNRLRDLCGDVQHTLAPAFPSPDLDIEKMLTALFRRRIPIETAAGCGASPRVAGACRNPSAMRKAARSVPRPCRHRTSSRRNRPCRPPPATVLPEPVRMSWPDR